MICCILFRRQVGKRYLQCQQVTKKTLEMEKINGELIFYHGPGTEKFMPEEWNTALGDMIDLSDVLDEKI